MPKKPKPLTITEFARMGGKARAKALTKRAASEIGKKAAAARWGTPAKCNCGAMTIDRAKKRGHKC